jgi:hypothetical protein
MTLYSDLRSLCEVSKKFQALTLPYLYRTVDLYPHTLIDRLIPAFTRDHPGLAYIRHVRIKELDWKSFYSSKNYSALRHLITIVPRDGLLEFE